MWSDGGGTIFVRNTGVLSISGSLFLVKDNSVHNLIGNSADQRFFETSAAVTFTSASTFHVLNNNLRLPALAGFVFFRFLVAVTSNANSRVFFGRNRCVSAATGTFIGTMGYVQSGGATLGFCENLVNSLWLRSFPSYSTQVTASC